MKKNNSAEETFQELLFVKESTKVYIPMSDGQDIFCQYILDDKTKSDYIIFFIQGFASGHFTWSDFWDALHEEFNMVIVDPRDKKSNELKKKSKCTIHRIALDFIEAIKFLKLDEKKLVLFGSSIGASYVAYLVGQEMIKPKGCFLTGTSRKPRSPRMLVHFFFLLPGFALNAIVKPIARIYMRNKLAEGFQKQIYKDRINHVDFRRWKTCKSLHDWDATEEFRKMSSPVFIIRTPDDKYHKEDEVKIIRELIPNCKIIDVPTYDYCHIKPGVYEFTQTIKKTILEEM
ncbi:MAG: alpha/beta hydrolase [Candidatus Heimdallarchaeota archaeon]|nr:alpha/beta hydrolase [Candidatus Heimdallarchaeota archaeon]